MCGCYIWLCVFICEFRFSHQTAKKIQRRDDIQKGNNKINENKKVMSLYLYIYNICIDIVNDYRVSRVIIRVDTSVPGPCRNQTN